MRAAGSGPEGPDPAAVFEVEAARRRLYARASSMKDVAAYERLLASQTVVERSIAEAATSETPRAPGRSPRRVAAAVAGTVAAAALIVLIAVGTRPGLPPRVPMPELAGTTLYSYQRFPDPNTGPRSITYQPEGYTVFHPEGRTVAVALTCVGDGKVRISAGRSFDFACTAGETRTRALRDGVLRTDPFMIVGTTVGNVVWAARIVTLDAPMVSGAIPSFRDGCEECEPLG